MDVRQQAQRGRDAKHLYDTVLKDIFDALEVSYFDQFKSTSLEGIELREEIYHKQLAMADLRNTINKIIGAGTYADQKIRDAIEQDKVNNGRK